jgi:hypothetical protein
MKHIAFALTLLAATAACNGTTPTDISPSLDGSVMGSGVGRNLSDDDGGHIGSGVGAESQDDGGLIGSGVGAQSADDGSGSWGSGCCSTTASTDDSGIVGSGGGRTGLVGAIGG